VRHQAFGIAFSYEGLNDHNRLRHDPVDGGTVGRARGTTRGTRASAGKSTLNRLQLSQLASTRYHKISHNPVAIGSVLIDLFLDAHAPAQ
jgi:hypothetical protein